MSFARWALAGIGLAAVGSAVAYAQYRDTEEPDYDVLFKEGDFELRQYAPMVVAEITHTGERRRAQSASFRRLAAYIFGKDRPAGDEEDIAMTSPVISERVDRDEKIAMTAPVFQNETAANEWRMRFVMPAKYTLQTLPTPPSDIYLAELPRRRVATIRFSGNARDTDLIIMEARLTDWIESQGLKPAGGFEYAFYDSPMVPGPLRRNEVLIEIENN